MISAYLGTALTLGAGLDYLIRLLLRRPPFSRRAHDLVTVLGAAIAVASVAIAGEPLWLAVVAGGLALVWFAVTRTQLAMPPPALRVAPGDPLPAFRVVTTDGSPFSRDDLVAAAPALLVLYRGKW